MCTKIPLNICGVKFFVYTSLLVCITLQKWKLRWFVLCSDGELSYFDNDKVLLTDGLNCVYVIVVNDAMGQGK